MDVPGGITIKKEVEDPEYNDNAETPDAGQAQADQNGQKVQKVWTDDESRLLIGFAKVYYPKFEDPNYTKKQLMDDISNEFQMLGYDRNPDHIRNKLKYLRNRYRTCIIYNSKHVEKKVIPFCEELEDLYSLDYFVQEGFLPLSQLNGHSSETSKRVSSSKSTSLPASHVDLRAVVTAKKKTSQVIHKGTKFVVKKKPVVKKNIHPLYQCGLCMGKFKTSQDMHGHQCAGNAGKFTKPQVMKKVNPSPSVSNNFHWNSLMTMHFLDILKEYQDMYKNSNFRKSNLWDYVSNQMKKRGVPAPAKELDKKWHVLTAAFDKATKYNRTHKDKKKCAFFKRLTDLYRHPCSFGCIRDEDHAKMTVEVSPFSFAEAATSSGSFSSGPVRTSQNMSKPVVQNGMGELMLWLENTWTEFKDIEKKREARQEQRHNELLEMLSCMIDSNGNRSNC